MIPKELSSKKFAKTNCMSVVLFFNLEINSQLFSKSNFLTYCFNNSNK